MTVTRFPNGIALGGPSVGGESNNKVYVYDSSGVLVGEFVLETQSALTTALTTITCNAPITPDYTIQDLTNSSPYGFVTVDEGQTVLNVIKNLQTRVNELEAR